MVVIVKKKGENKDSLFRKFTRMYVEDEWSLKVKEHQFYKRPSQVNKEKKYLYESMKKRRRQRNK